MVEPPILFEEREQFTIELAPAARARVTLYTREGERLPDLAYGQRVEFEGKARAPHNFVNPGSFDYASYLARKDIFWTASGRADTLRVLPGSCGTRFERAIFSLRTSALERLERLYSGDAWSTAMTQAILIGETGRLEKAWTEGFRHTGTYHALIISGMHVSVLAGFLLLLLRVCGFRTEVALLFTALAAWLYALVSGWQAPVVRSAGGLLWYRCIR